MRFIVPTEQLVAWVASLEVGQEVAIESVNPNTFSYTYQVGRVEELMPLRAIVRRVSVDTNFPGGAYEFRIAKRGTTLTTFAQEKDSKFLRWTRNSAAYKRILPLDEAIHQHISIQRVRVRASIELAK